MALFNVLFDIASKTASFDASMVRIESQFERIGQVAQRIGGILGVSLGAGSIVEFTNRALDAGNAIYLMSQKAGTTAQAFSQIAYAARSSGVDVGSLSAAFARMQNVISKAGSGDTGLDYLFAEIGVSVKALKQLSPELQFEAIAQAISKVPDPANRAQAAIAIFGRSGADLLPLLEQGAGGIGKLENQADQLGVTLTNLSAKQMHDAKDAIDQMDSAWNALYQTLATKLSPVLIAAAGSLRQLAGGSTDIENLQDKIMGLKAAQADALNFGDNDSVAKYQAAIDAISRQIDAAKNQLAPSVPSQVTKSMTDALGFGPAIPEITVSAQRLRELQQSIFDQWNDDTATQEEKALQRQRDFYAEIGILLDQQKITPLDAVSRLSAFNEQNVPPTIQPIDPHIKKLQTDSQKMAQAMRETITGASAGMAQDFYQFFLNPADIGIRGLAKDFIVQIQQMVAKQAELNLFGTSGETGPLGTFFSSIFGSIGGGNSSGLTSNDLSVAAPDFDAALAVVPSINFLAAGGQANAGRSYIVGEEGPEIFTPGASGVVSPNSAIGGGGGDIRITNQIDARGATVDAIQLLPSAMKQASDNAVQRVVDMRRRGAL